MKKIVFFCIMLVLLTGCSLGANNSRVMEEFDVDLVNTLTTNDSLKFSVSSSMNDLHYKVMLNEEIIKQGEVKEVNEVYYLDSNTTYNIIIYNTIYSDTFTLTTSNQ